MKNISNKYINSFNNNLLNLRVYLISDGLCKSSDIRYKDNISELCKKVEEIYCKLNELRENIDMINTVSDSNYSTGKCDNCELRKNDTCISYSVINKIVL